MGLHLLAILLRARREHPGSPQPIDHKIQQAQELLARRYHERLNVERLARELNVSYSSFRQAFKPKPALA